MLLAKIFFAGLEAKRKLKEAVMGTGETAEPGGIYALEMRTIDGAARSLSGYKGKVCLIVNVASECGFTPQYEGLEELYRRYKDKGLRILAFPANDFGAQEPGTDAEIRTFCSTRYAVTFDLFSKIVVRGRDIHPLYKLLTCASGRNGEIPWNFSKFLIDKNGAVATRFGPETEPLSGALVKAVEKLLD